MSIVELAIGDVGILIVVHAMAFMILLLALGMMDWKIKETLSSKNARVSLDINHWIFGGVLETNLIITLNL